MGYYNIFKNILFFLKYFFSKKVIKRLLIFAFIVLSLVFFSSKVFAVTGTYNYDTSSFTTSTLNYVKRCTDLVQNYAINNNLSYTYYFIFYHSGSTGNLNDNNVVFKILLFNNNVYVSTNGNGVLNGDGMTYCFDFKTGEDLSTKTIKANSVKAHAAFSGFRVLWTNYEQEPLVSLAPVPDGFFNTYSNPTLETPSADIQNWSFDNLVINLNNLDIYDNLNNLRNFSLDINYISDYNNFNYSIDCNGSGYLDINNKTITIPKNDLLKNYVIDNFSLSFMLYVRGVGSLVSYDLGTFAIAISQEQADVINGQNSLDNVNNSINNVNNSINNVNNSISNIDNTITNSNIDNSNIADFNNLSNGFEVEDNTGIDTLFQMVYNAFCLDSVQDLELTIPFVNKTFTISSANVSANFPAPIKSIVGVFVWGFIALWVLKDIRTIIDKISEGAPESVGSDIKKEVL